MHWEWTKQCRSWQTIWDLTAGWLSALKLGCVCTQCSEGRGCVNGFVCVLMFVFCVCLTAVVLSGLFANKLVRRAATRLRKDGRGPLGCREREAACQETPGPSRKGKSDNSFSILIQWWVSIYGFYRFKEYTYIFFIILAGKCVHWMKWDSRFQSWFRTAQSIHKTISHIFAFCSD